MMAQKGESPTKNVVFFLLLVLISCSPELTKSSVIEILNESKPSVVTIQRMEESSLEFVIHDPRIKGPPPVFVWESSTIECINYSNSYENFNIRKLKKYLREVEETISGILDTRFPLDEFAGSRYTNCAGLF